MTAIRAHGSLLTASVDDRTLTYLLLPYGEEGRTSAGRVTASKGRLTLPDPSGLVANLEHNPTRPVARFVSIEEADAGLTATLRVLATSAGDDLLVEAVEGVRTGISVEIDGPVIRQGNLMGGTLAGAGFVTTPAFPSAQLVATDAGDLPDDFPEWLAPGSTSSTTVERRVIDGATYEVTSTNISSTQVEVIDAPGTSGGTTEGDSPTTQEATVADTKATDEQAVEDTEQDRTVEETETQEDAVSKDDEKVTAAAPAKAAAGGLAARRVETAVKRVERTAGETARMLASAHQSGGKRGLLAALSDITPNDILGVEQPQYLGELWSGKAHVRRIIPLFNHADLTSYRVQGWKWGTKPVVAPYAGNKAAVPSNDPTTLAVEILAKRLAGAHDIDRKFRDFNDTEFFNAYFKAMAESYSRVSDAQVLADVLAEATEVTRGTVPGNVPAGLVSVVDGALAVLAATDTVPTFAVIATDLYRDVLLTPKDDTLGYLSAALGIEEGELGDFRLIPSSALAAGTTLVGAKDAVTVHELAGSPIRVDAVDLANGGVDEGLFGYYATNVHEAKGLALVTV